MIAPQATPLALGWHRINCPLACLFLGLTGLGALAEISRHFALSPGLREIAVFANLLEEGNLPTWYISMLLLACAALLMAIAANRTRAKDRDGWRWLLLAVAFLYISVDELVMIHEGLNAPLQDALGASGILYFAWVLPFGALAALLFVGYLGYLARLPRLVRLLFVAGGLLYVGGALGTELGVSVWYERNGGDNLVYGLLNIWQESLEILGVTVFCSGLFAYIGHLGRASVASHAP